MRKIIIACIFIVTCKLHAQPISIIAEKFRYDSIISFDFLGNHIEKAIYTFTQYGAPIISKGYIYNQLFPNLIVKKSITNDNGNNFITLDSNLAADGSWTILQTKWNLDENGYGINYRTGNSQLSIELNYDIYYGINKQIDSVFTEYLGFVFEKYIYKYNLDGILIRLEKYDYLTNTTTMYEYTYTKNENSGLMKRYTESYTYINGILKDSLNRKEILSYDIKERPIRNEIYAWDSQETNWSENYHTFVIWYYPASTNIKKHIQQINEDVTIWKNNENLIVCSPYSENIKIYSINGSCLYVIKKKSGDMQISLNFLPKGIYVIKGNNWTKKIHW